MYGLDTKSRVNFVHIPKTGGTSVESALWSVNISVGAASWLLGREFHDWKSTYNYSLGENSGSMTSTLAPQSVASWAGGPISKSPCSPWHVPPEKLVSNSFTIVRDPKQRLESEFNFRNFSHKGQTFSASVRGFESWVGVVLQEATINRHILDCHLIPQYEFARQVNLIVPYDCLHFNWTTLLDTLYGVDVAELHKFKAPVHNNWHLQVSDTTKRLVRNFFALDYIFLSSFF